MTPAERTMKDEPYYYKFSGRIILRDELTGEEKDAMKIYFFAEELVDAQSEYVMRLLKFGIHSVKDRSEREASKLEYIIRKLETSPEFEAILDREDKK